MDDPDYIDFDHKTTYALLAQQEVCLPPEAGLTFLKVRGFEESSRTALPADWRLATHEEVKRNLEKVKKKLGPWDICMLADNWKVDGPSYGCNVQMRVGDERMGHAIFVTGREDACEELPDAGVAKDPVEPKSPKDAQEPGGCGCEGYYELGMQKAIAAKDDALAGLANFVSEARALRRTFRGASWRLAQLLLPAALVAASMLSESVSSRLATVYYVRYMRVLEELLGDAGSQLPNPLHREWISTHHHDYPQKLQDLTASWLQEPLVVTQWFWDVTVVPLPMMALLAMFLCKHKLVYCKAALVFAALLSGRAACGLLTVVPDASGWEQCQQRLNKRGIEDMGTHAELLDFRNDFWGSLLEVLSVEVGGSRYCGDMIYSKHCFILLLSTLVINDLLGRCHGHRRCIRVVIGVLTWTYTISASFATIAARYHYSLDVFLAFSITILLYDSNMVNCICLWWAQDPEEDEERKEEARGFMIGRKKVETSSVISLGMDIVSHMADVCLHIYVATSLYLNGQIKTCTVYVVSIALTGWLLTIYSWMDDDLKKMNQCLRLLACPIFGFLHLIFAWKAYAAYRNKYLALEQLRIVKTIHATLQATPIGITTLALVVDNERVRTTWAYRGRLLSAICSIRCIGNAASSLDGTESSVLCRLVQNPVWKEMVGIFRMTEITARLLCGLLLHEFCRDELGDAGIFVVPAVALADFVCTAALARLTGVATRLLACLSLAVVSLMVNVNFFQRDEEREEFANFLVGLRVFEYVAVAAAAGCHFKFVEGGSEALMGFVRKDPALFGAALFFMLSYPVAVVFWTQIKKRARVEEQWESQS